MERGREGERKGVNEGGMGEEGRKERKDIKEGGFVAQLKIKGSETTFASPLVISLLLPSFILHSFSPPFPLVLPPLPSPVA